MHSFISFLFFLTFFVLSTDARSRFSSYTTCLSVHYPKYVTIITGVVKILQGMHEQHHVNNLKRLCEISTGSFEASCDELKRVTTKVNEEPKKNKIIVIIETLILVILYVLVFSYFLLFFLGKGDIAENFIFHCGKYIQTIIEIIESNVSYCLNVFTTKCSDSK